jgi:molybdate transport system ATP-binding protein
MDEPPDLIRKGRGMRLSVAVKKRLGRFQLDATFEAEAGVIALFGRSGSGKTSLLRQIAGLSHPDSGQITYENHVLVNVAQRVRIAPYKRHFGYVFQDARLFPHLTVRQNLDYGRTFSAKPKSRVDADQILAILDLEPLLTRKPHHLSGGEKQRVAMGRALLSSPDLLLLDEPLASLDDRRKQEILPLLEQMRDNLKIPMVYVSHSVMEVARLATTVVVLKDGTVESVGPAAAVFHDPQFQAALDRNEAGSILSAVVESHDPAFGLSTVTFAGGRLFVPGPELPVGRHVRIYIPARDVLLSTQTPEGLSALNNLKGTVLSITPDGEHSVTVRVDCAGSTIAARVTTLSVQRLDLHPGMAIHAIIKTVALDPRS